MLIYSNRALSILYNFLTLKEFSNYHVLLPTNICHDVFFLMQFTKKNFTFIDINIESYELDKAKIESSATEKKKTILLWNHTYGNPTTPYHFFKQLKEKNFDIIIIDDRCLCNPLDYKNNKDDKYIDLILYSSGYAKQVDLGSGAMGIWQDKYEVNLNQYDFNAENYLVLKKMIDGDKPEKVFNFNKIAWEQVEFKNFEKSYSAQLINEYSKWKVHKNKLKNIYLKNLDKDLILINQTYNNWRFNILLENKEEVLFKIFENNFFASSHYPSIGTLLKLGSFPNAEWLYSKIINLFIDKYFSEKQALGIVNIINKYARPIKLSINNIS